VTHEQVWELLPAFALHALDHDQAQDVAAHLASCDRCRHELAALLQITDELGTAVAQVAPPPGLRDAVLARIRPRRDVITLTRGWPVGLAAAAVVIVVLAALGTSLYRQLAVLSARLAAQEQVLSLLAAPSARSVALTGEVPATVRFVFDPERRQGALVVAELRDPGRESVYQLWLIAGTRPESAGVFRPTPGQPVVLPVAADFTRYQAVAVSVERAPAGASQPTATPILVGKF